MAGDTLIERWANDDDPVSAVPAPKKDTDPLAWAAHQNNLTAMAEEIVLKELVYN